MLWALGLTAALGMAFLVVKGFEHRKDVRDHLIPGTVAFPLEPPQTQILFSFHRLLTGVHAVHLTVGTGAVARRPARRRRRSPRLGAEGDTARDGALLAPDRRGVDRALPTPLPPGPRMSAGAGRERPSAGALWRRAGLVWLALSGLLAATILGAYLPLEARKPVVGQGIAALEAGLVTLIFMGLFSTGALVRFAAATGVLFVAVLFFVTFADETTRQHRPGDLPGPIEAPGSDVEPWQPVRPRP